MVHKIKRETKNPTTDFSRFFVLGKDKSKKKLLREVVKKANEDQRHLFQSP